MLPALVSAPRVKALRLRQVFRLVSLTPVFPSNDSDPLEMEFGYETHGCGTAAELHSLPFKSPKRNVLANHNRHFFKCECKDTAFF